MNAQTKRPKGDIEVLYSTDAIAERVTGLADEIAAEVGPEPLLVAILKGSFVFTADLIRAMHGAGMRPVIDFMMLSSYGTATASKGRVDIKKDVSDDVRGRSIVLIDDILESGRTLRFARDHLMERGAAEVKSCVLLHKPGKEKVTFNADYVGFTVPNLFVIGYGLDYAHYFRELPYIGVLKRDAEK